MPWHQGLLADSVLGHRCWGHPRYLSGVLSEWAWQGKQLGIREAVDFATGGLLSLNPWWSLDPSEDTQCQGRVLGAHREDQS